MAQKKNFKAQAESVLNSSPAMMFIDASAAPLAEAEPERPAAPTEREDTAAQSAAPETTAPPPAPRPEAKSRRVQLLMRPSTHTAIQKAADRCGISFNEWVNNALENALKGR